MNVSVIGLGCISAIANDATSHIEAFRKELDGIAALSLFHSEHKFPVAEVKLSNRQLADALSLNRKRELSRTAMLAIYAAREAYYDAFPDGLPPISNPRIGIISSTTTGGMDLTEAHIKQYQRGPEAVGLATMLAHDAADSTEQIARYLGIDGFRSTISTACSSAANAIMLAARMIKLGMLDIAIAGGCDALCRFTINGFASLMVLDPEPCRPFDASRAGLNLGEGAGYLVLCREDLAHSTSYCTLNSWANSNDAYHQTASSPDGVAAHTAMQTCINEAKLDPTDISYINTHGTGTSNNDASEAVAIQRLFGSTPPPFSSTKSFTGHCLGAAAGIEAVYSVLALKNGLLYPNLRYQEPIEECPLVPITTFSEGRKLRHVLSNSFGFGGNNSSLLFSLPETKQF